MRASRAASALLTSSTHRRQRENQRTVVAVHSRSSAASRALRWRDAAATRGVFSLAALCATPAAPGALGGLAGPRGTGGRRVAISLRAASGAGAYVSAAESLLCDRVAAHRHSLGSAARRVVCRPRAGGLASALCPRGLARHAAPRPDLKRPRKRRICAEMELMERRGAPRAPSARGSRPISEVSAVGAPPRPKCCRSRPQTPPARGHTCCRPDRPEGGGRRREEAEAG